MEFLASGQVMGDNVATSKKFFDDFIAKRIEKLDREEIKVSVSPE
jgi:hypothetical protein